MRQLTLEDLIDIMDEALEQQAAEEAQAERDAIEYEASLQQSPASALYTIMYNAILGTASSRFPTLEEIEALALASQLPNP